MDTQIYYFPHRLSQQWLWRVVECKPCSPMKVKRRFRGTCLFHSSGKRSTCFVPVSSYYSSNLKMEATCSSETLLAFQTTIRCYNPDDRKSSIPFCSISYFIQFIFQICISMFLILGVFRSYRQCNLGA
jgi:hypothetical protein